MYKAGMVVLFKPLGSEHPVVEESDFFPHNYDVRKPRHTFTSKYCNEHPERFEYVSKTFNYEQWKIDRVMNVTNEKTKLDANVLQEIGKACKEIKSPPRMPAIVMLKVTEEVGELAQEVAIHHSISKKPEGADGVLGEAADVIVSVVDVAFLAGYTINELEIKIMEKLQKWKKQNS